MAKMSTIEDLIAGGNDEAEMAKRRGMSAPQENGDEYIDRFEGNTAVMIKKLGDGYVTRDVPRELLPAGSRAGDVVKAQDVRQSPSLYGEKNRDVVNSLYGAMFPR